MQGREYGLVGFACDFGQTIKGSRRGPASLRERGILGLFQQLGHVVHDYGDVLPDSNHTPQTPFTEAELRCNAPREVYSCCAELYNRTTEILRDSRVPFILGGDHSLSIGGVAAVADHYGAKNKRVGLLWVDAHPDINTPETTPSNNFYGMSVAVLAGLVPGAMSSLQKYAPAVTFSNLSYVGLRDVDPQEKTLLRARSTTAFSMSAIDEIQIKEVMDRALAAVLTGTEGFVLSLDLDACDPNFAPGTGSPKRGGLTYRESHYVLERAAASGKLLGIELVELNPSLDQNRATAEVAISLVESILGKTIL